jgi:uncharacterized protein DUF4177
MNLKATLKCLLVPVLASFVFVGCCTTPNKTAQWEYTAVDYGNADIANVDAALNNSAAEGWMLVAAVPIKSANGEDEIRYIFKRPKH